MPNITLTWTASLYSPRAEQYGDNDWIFSLKWRRTDNDTLITRNAGLYIIQDSDGDVVYAGKADNFRNRFEDRADAVQELGLSRDDAVLGHRVKIATVNPGLQLSLAEQWLIRILYIRDQANMEHLLQNINLTGQFQAPADGLTITNNNNRPNYLNANYNYAGGANI
ncbi:MAG TPA: GIY-YIG nuclease family protein [Candidatus Acidoferrales bacterium]|nr:GIY-YIG nuclease family protein [Candidatus Acidoferrales bacterium]